MHNRIYYQFGRFARPNSLTFSLVVPHQGGALRWRNKDRTQGGSKKTIAGIEAGKPEIRRGFGDIGSSVAKVSVREQASRIVGGLTHGQLSGIPTSRPNTNFPDSRLSNQNPRYA
jgi:hypothetical protein